MATEACCLLLTASSAHSNPRLTAAASPAVAQAQTAVREAKEAQDLKDSKDSKDNKGSKDSKDSKGSKDSNHSKDSKLSMLLVSGWVFSEIFAFRFGFCTPKSPWKRILKSGLRILVSDSRFTPFDRKLVRKIDPTQQEHRFKTFQNTSLKLPPNIRKLLITQ